MVERDADVVVVGAGIQGVGIAQAAQAAGFDAIVLDKSHVAAGTSSRSSKLIHGGLRYLENGEFRFVREALREREILLRIAPHLVRLVPFHIPVYRSGRRPAWQIRAGLSLYSLLGGMTADTRFQSLPRRSFGELDGLNGDGLHRVFRYLDGQTDDAALCRAVLASAAELGACYVPHAELQRAELDGDRWSFEVAVDGEQRRLRAALLINAAGPWAPAVLDRVERAHAPLPVDLVGGTHVLCAGTLERGIYYLEAPADGRAVFLMPYQGRTLIGTTETPFAGDPDTVRPTDAECDYLLGVARHAFPTRAFEVETAFAGLRVLPSAEGSAVRRKREVQLIADDPRTPRLITVYGGKLTAYRSTAEKVMRLVRRGLRPAASRRADTATLRLPDLRGTPHPLLTGR